MTKAKKTEEKTDTLKTKKYVVFTEEGRQTVEATSTEESVQKVSE